MRYFQWLCCKIQLTRTLDAFTWGTTEFSHGAAALGASAAAGWCPQVCPSGLEPRREAALSRAAAAVGPHSSSVPPPPVRRSRAAQPAAPARTLVVLAQATPAAPAVRRILPSVIYSIRLEQGRTACEFRGEWRYEQTRLLPAVQIPPVAATATSCRRCQPPSAQKTGGHTPQIFMCFTIAYNCMHAPHRL